MDTKKLEALAAAVQYGSFTRAAEALGYTQSGMTHMMNSLERDIGFPVLLRGRGGVRLTPAGERIYPLVREVLAASQSLDREIAPLEIASWRRPKGGYFVSLYAMPGTAKRTLALCKEAGVTMTGAGATFPYGKDPADSNIRIAPSLPPVAELEQAVLHLKTITSVTESAFYIRDAILSRMAALRVVCDEAETVTDERCWPFPTYGDLLFGVR